MNDEINHELTGKVMSLTFQAVRFDARTLQKAMQAYLRNRQGRKVGEIRHGKMKVEKLVGQGQGATAIEVTDDNIKSFEKIARKYHVDFAVKKDKTVNPPKYMVFFKGKDTDVITQAFKEFVKYNEQQKTKVSVRQKLRKFANIVEQNKNRERTREKVKSREQSL